ncbi:hypothetical protein ACIQF6_33270 [Kitasatospora sp. NPDC092948]|uniref:hypothetical protein n=1 Tax=Kitasatospora sp. NPDC092948 TaxID=3364088 RepID=UPI00380E42ED
MVTAWLTAEGSAAAPAIMALIHQGTHLSASERAWCAEELLDAGATAEAAVVATLALRSPLWEESYYEDAAGVLVKARPAEFGPVVEQILAEDPEPSVDWLAGVLAAFRSSTAFPPPLVSTLARRLLADPLADGQRITTALGDLIAVEGLGSLPEAIDTIKSRTHLSVSQIRGFARLLASNGQREAALECWRHALDVLWLPSDQELALLNDLLAADAGPEAASWLREMIDRPGLGEQSRLRLRQLLAWLGPALEPDAG